MLDVWRAVNFRVVGWFRRSTNCGACRRWRGACARRLRWLLRDVCAFPKRGFCWFRPGRALDGFFWWAICSDIPAGDCSYSSNSKSVAWTFTYGTFAALTTAARRAARGCAAAAHAAFCAATSPRGAPLKQEPQLGAAPAQLPAATCALPRRGHAALHAYAH